MKIYSTIPSAIEDLRNGKMLIVVDSPDRENQADIIFPAELADEEKVNFLMKICRGPIYIPLTSQIAANLHLPLMVPKQNNTEVTGVNFTVSVDVKTVKDFGISASDMAHTIKAISDSKSKPVDFVRPGHVFPLLAARNGLLERQGHTEAVVTLCKLAGYAPCGVLSVALKENGQVARLVDLQLIAKKYGMGIVSITDIVAYIKAHPQNINTPSMLVKEASAVLPTSFGTFQLTIYKSLVDNLEHLVLSMEKS